MPFYFSTVILRKVKWLWLNSRGVFVNSPNLHIERILDLQRYVTLQLRDTFATRGSWTPCPVLLSLDQIVSYTRIETWLENINKTWQRRCCQAKSMSQLDILYWKKHVSRKRKPLLWYVHLYPWKLALNWICEMHIRIWTHIKKWKQVINQINHLDISLWLESKCSSFFFFDMFFLFFFHLVFRWGKVLVQES